jgi:hypothetical protein
MKKIMIALYVLFAYQSMVLTEVSITLSKLIDGTVGTVLLGANITTVGRTNSELLPVVTDGTKVPLYFETDVPYGWGIERGTQWAALAYGGYPNPEACYIQGSYVYDPDGNQLGEFKGVFTTESEAATNGWVKASYNNKNVYLRVTNDAGSNNVDISKFGYDILLGYLGTKPIEPYQKQASNVVGEVENFTLSKSDQTSSRYYRCFTHETLPQDHFFVVWIKTAA